MVNFLVHDEVGWLEDGVILEGAVDSEPNEMGEFYVLLTGGGIRTLDALDLPDEFTNYSEAMIAPADRPTPGVVITKPQQQSLWPYVLFMVAGGALILNL